MSQPNKPYTLAEWTAMSMRCIPEMANNPEELARAWAFCVMRCGHRSKVPQEIQALFTSLVGALSDDDKRLHTKYAKEYL